MQQLPKFLLGTWLVHWLREVDVPLFISNRQLKERRTFPRANTTWYLDSGGFSEISMFGSWQTKPKDYVIQVRRYSDEIGKLGWAAIQDMMCEPDMLEITGLTTLEHQTRTIDSYETLLSLDDTLPWTPVLQGYSFTEYQQHFDMYIDRGFDLRNSPVVGIGSICRRQTTTTAQNVVKYFHKIGLKLHAFGIKTTGLPYLFPYIVSCDSMAWSYNARKNERLPGCVGHKKCNNCQRFALRWRETLLKEGYCS